MHRILFVSAFWVIACCAVSATGHRLFTISKNTNGSCVCFDARSDSSAAVYRDRLVSCYWHLPQGATKALNVVERMVYGYTIKPDSCGYFRMTFHRFPGQAIWLIWRDGVYRALTCVAGRSIWLDDIHLVFQNGSIARPVMRIELRGRDTRDAGEAVLTIDPAASRIEHPPGSPVANLHVFNRGSTSP